MTTSGAFTVSTPIELPANACKIAILHHVSPYTYLSHSRPFENGPLNTSDYLERRNGLAAGSVSQSLGLAVSNGGLDYSALSPTVDPP